MQPTKKPRTRIAVVSGSHRPSSQSAKVAAYVAGEIEKLGDAPAVVDLAATPLPLWDEGHWSDEEPWVRAWHPISKRLAASDAVVLVTPEWSGMVTPAIKNLLLLCNRGELAHKPGLAVAVSASRGGAYPIAELRMSSTKNNHLVYIPDHVIVRDAKAVLNGPEPETPEDGYLRDRIGYALAMLREYARALAQVRRSGVVDLERYPHGM
jgi:NAD(P)H-dependent FMN reductase